MHITLRQLRYFVEIAQSRSFSKASKRLLVAQPALSQNISALEQHLGVALLERHARGVDLTAAGERFLLGAQEMLSQAAALKELTIGQPQTPGGPVQLAIAGSLASVIAGPLLSTLAKQYPAITLSFQEGLSFEIRASLESGQSHLALMPNPSDIPGLGSLPVFEESFMLFGPPATMRKTPASIAFAQLTDLPLALPDGAHDLRKIIERVASAGGYHLNVQYELNSAQILTAIAKEGLAYAVMPPTACMDAIAAKTLTGRPISDPELTRVQAIAWSRQRPLTPAVKAVSSCIQSVVKRLIQTGQLPARLLYQEL